MGDGLLVLVTVHGIGFQQPPTNGVQGYADELHKHLRGVPALGELLGDDPNRAGGPVYVESEFKGSRSQGLERLDPGQPLAASGRIAHVALVYSPSEPQEIGLGSVLETFGRGAFSLRKYATLLGALRLILSDARVALTHRAPVPAEGRRPSLRPALRPSVRFRHGMLLKRGYGAAPPASPGLLEVIRALLLDVASYVARNDVRERVRGFVQEALLKILDRPDTAALVVNAHSQGTVLCWDVLCRLPFFSWQQRDDRRNGMLRQFVTAGSPIRKYVDLVAWGAHIGELAAPIPNSQIKLWTNFWDMHDPVADPLDPARAWRVREPLEARRHKDIGLLEGHGPNRAPPWHVTVDDREVDNVANSTGGGLSAHDYWDNQSQFIDGLAGILVDSLPPRSGVQ